MNILVLRLDAPVMSFGAPMIDRHGMIQPYPALSMMTGMLGNALGYDHADFAKLGRLQERLKYAVREDKRGQRIRDYQTVDLSQSFMRDEAAWTTYGIIEKRKGGSAGTGTHERYRYYWADAVYTIVLTLDPIDESPTIDELQDCIQFPERPLFLGRKTCMPSTPVHLCRITCHSLEEALKKVELSKRADKQNSHRAWWQVDADVSQSSKQFVSPAVDRKDWSNQIHVGERWVAQSQIKVENKEGSDDATHR